MIKRPTLILLFVLVLAVAAYFLIKNQPSKRNALTPTPTTDSFIIPQSFGTLQSLRIFDNKGNNFQMQRDMSKAWVITAPSSGAADQGLAGAAETQVGALRIITKLATPPASATVGLTSPIYTMVFGFVSGASHKLEIGNMTPTSSGYYARLDGGDVYVIDQPGIDSLTNLLIAPPFPATATPDATSAPTATPLPETASPTP